MSETRRLPGGEHAEEGDFIDVNSQNISGLEEDIDAELDTVLSEFDKDENDVVLEVKVYKSVPNSGKADYLFTCTPDELPVQDRVRDEYGPGQYQVRLYRTIGGKGKNLFRRFAFGIGSPRVGIAQTQHRNNTDESLAGVVQTMMEQQRVQMEQFQKMMLAAQTQNAPAQPTSMVDMMQGLAGMMTAMQTMMPQQNAGGGVEQLIQGITLAKDMFGGERSDGRESNLYDALTETVKTFGPVMASAVTTPRPVTAAKPQPKPGAVVPLPAPGTGQPTTTQPAQAEEEIQMNMIKKQMLKTYVAQLVQKAAENGDSSLYAELICDNLNDEELTFFVTGDSGLDNLAQINPAVNQYRPWFDKLRAEVLDLLTEPSAESTLEPSINESGNGPDAGDSPTS